MSIINNNVDVVILCGGLGTRLGLKQPKSLAKIGNTTFIDILLNEINEINKLNEFSLFKNIILCTGHLKEQITKHFEYCHNDIKHNYNIIFSEEETPLGTGGALKNAKSLIKSEHLMVTNGDSICNVDYDKFFKFHINNNAMLSIVLSNKNQSSDQDYGHVITDELDRIISFNEKLQKITNENKLINAGVYLMKREIFNFMPCTNIFSLEYDLFPELCKKEHNKCYGFIVNSEVIDIGTPKRYRKALEIMLNRTTTKHTQLLNKQNYD